MLTAHTHIPRPLTTVQGQGRAGATTHRAQEGGKPSHGEGRLPAVLPVLSAPTGLLQVPETLGPFSPEVDTTGVTTRACAYTTGDTMAVSLWLAGPSLALESQVCVLGISHQSVIQAS